MTAVEEYYTGLRARHAEQEARILELLAAGYHDAEISKLLGVNGRTYRRRVTALMGRLGARTRAHAVALSITAEVRGDCEAKVQDLARETSRSGLLMRAIAEAGHLGDGEDCGLCQALYDATRDDARGENR